MTGEISSEIQVGQQVEYSAGIRFCIRGMLLACRDMRNSNEGRGNVSHNRSISLREIRGDSRGRRAYKFVPVT